MGCRGLVRRRGGWGQWPDKEHHGEGGQHHVPPSPGSQEGDGDGEGCEMRVQLPPEVSGTPGKASWSPVSLAQYW